MEKNEYQNRLMAEMPNTIMDGPKEDRLSERDDDKATQNISS